ncbi:hypothetical protein [Streptomyces virginiae]|uniref:hypothetical protein n=1 Tax=Streptomyces virginiae TaxID=1961 RepID=UPI0037B48537
MSVTINAHSLGRLLDKVTGHIGGDHVEVIHGVRLEVDSTYLYAVASDRYTMAAARYRHGGEENGEPFARTIPARCLRSLREWTTLQEGQHSIAVSTEPGRLVFTSPAGDLRIAVTDNMEFPDWRGLIRGALDQPACEEPFTALNAGFLSRWSAAGDVLRVRVPAEDKAVAVFATDFVGLQMPIRYSGVGPVPKQSFGDAKGTWAWTLSGGADALDMAKAMPADDDRPRYYAPTDLREVGEDLLRQVLRSNTDMHGKSGDQPEEFRAHVVGAVSGWAAYRYLDALHKADPRLAAEIVTDVAEQLDSGEIGEFAWDAAEAAGFDPQKWDDEYQNHLAEQAEKKQGSFADRLAAALNEVRRHGIGFTVEDNAHVAFDEQHDEWTAISTDSAA